MELAEGGGERDFNDRKQQGRGGGGDQVQPQQPPLPCPRCDSLDTKFCYYNNYSLAQPRYYCKTCKRHWTKGGTMRNIPVGGGSRKRANNPSSSSRQQKQPPQPPSKETVVLQPQQPNLTDAPFDHGGGGGYLSSLATIHSLQHPFEQSLKLGGDVAGGSSSNLGGLVPGFNVTPLASQRQIRPLQFFQREVDQSLYNRPAEQGFIIPPSMANSNNSAASQSVWPQNFINNANNIMTSDDDPLWSTISTTTSISGNSTERNGTTAGSDSPLIPNHWPDFPGYGPPPP